MRVYYYVSDKPPVLSETFAPLVTVEVVEYGRDLFHLEYRDSVKTGLSGREVESILYKMMWDYVVVVRRHRRRYHILSYHPFSVDGNSFYETSTIDFDEALVDMEIKNKSLVIQHD